MALTKQQIFEQMSKDRPGRQTPSKTRSVTKPSDKDQFADLVSKLKGKKKEE